MGAGSLFIAGRAWSSCSISKGTTSDNGAKEMGTERDSLEEKAEGEECEDEALGTSGREELDEEGILLGREGNDRSSE